MLKASDAVRAALKGNDPSPEQWEVINAPSGAMSVIAGAGAGKTAVMAARIVHLIEEGHTAPDEVIGLTFTNKAAAELEERINFALELVEPAPRSHPVVQTYNSFAAEIVRIHGPRINLDADSALLSDAAKWQLLEDIMDELPSFEYLQLRHPLSFIPQTLQLADACANHLVEPSKVREACLEYAKTLGGFEGESMLRRAELCACVEVYTKAKRSRKRIDFGDQVALAARILEKHSWIATEYGRRFKVILLDEYQDTNPAQKKMLQLIAAPQHSVTAVGDARQAIYAWRGASMWNLIGFPGDFGDPASPAPSLSLSTNYRCADPIVELSNKIIAPIPDGRRGGDAVRGTGAPGEIHVRQFPDELAEAKWIAETTRRIHDESGVAWSEISVLVRSRKNAIPIVSAFADLDIPAESPDLEGLLAVPAVVDAIAWLHVVSDSAPHTNRWAARILMGPRYRIHYSDLAAVARFGTERAKQLAADRGELNDFLEAEAGTVNYSLLDNLVHIQDIEGVSPEAVTRISDFNTFLEKLRTHTTRPLPELLRTLIDETGLLDELYASGSDIAKAQISDLSSFCALATDFDPAVGNPTVSGFLSFLELCESADDTLAKAMVPTADSVKVLTVHSAKGLEFDTVFVPCIAASQELTNDLQPHKKDSQFPMVRANNPLSNTSELPPSVRADSAHLPELKNKTQFKREIIERAIEDERRLFYVAVTRAKTRLHLSCAWWYEPDRHLGPSEFFDELLKHSELFESVELAPDPDINPLESSHVEQWAWPPREPSRPEEAKRWASEIERIREPGFDIDTYLDDEGRATYEELKALTTTAKPGSIPTPQRVVSVTAACELVAGRLTSDEFTRPTPATTGAEAKLGSAVHSWIEDKLVVSLTGLADEDESEPEVVLDPEVWSRSGFADREIAVIESTGEPMVEVPVTLKVGDVLLRGRVDAVFVTDTGFEVVDFKTGRRSAEPNWGQLEVYAEALHGAGVLDGEITLTYAWLGEGANDSKSYVPSGGKFAGRFDPDGRLATLN